jgi:hypothetical protein
MKRGLEEYDYNQVKLKEKIDREVEFFGITYGSAYKVK